MKNKRLLAGIFWLLVFLGIILFVARNKPIINFNPFEQIPFLDRSESGDKTTTVLQNRVLDEESTVINVVENVSPAVVSIVVRTVGYDRFSGPFSTEDGIGTGFIVDGDGIVVTNSHVVDGSDGNYSVVTKDGETYEVTAVHLDQLTDLAILEVSANNLTAASLGDSDTLKVGQLAIAIGNALGRFGNTVTTGVISGVAREVTASGGPFGGDAKTYEDVIQTDAALNPGNSGGPLLNSAGQVIGINVATTRGADNIGFAIPVNTLKPLLQSFLEEGRIVRPYIGVSYTIVSAEIAEIRNLPEGAFINQVIPESPADVAGIEEGDIITRLDGEDINSTNSLSKFLAKKEVGDIVNVTVNRDGRDLTLQMTLQEAPARF